jgi:hypothetical protein
MPNPFFAPQVITIGYYYKPPLYYARTVAIPGGRAILINKRRFTRAL